MTADTEFLLIACDGIWNVKTSQEAVDFVRQRLDFHGPSAPLSLISSELCDECLAPDTSGDGSGCDNMTAVIVQFHAPHAIASDSGALSVPSSGLAKRPPQGDDGEVTTPNKKTKAN